MRLELTYEDRTPFGSVVGGRAEMQIRKACSAIAEHRAQHGMTNVVARSEALLAAAFSTELAPLFSGKGTLHEACLYPRAELVEPATLRVTRGDALLATLPLASELRRELARFTHDLYRGTTRPDRAPGRALFDALEACGALTRDPRAIDPIPEALSVFVGHATVALRGRILVDPFLLPRADHYPASYQPLRAADLDPVAVFITHSHPDHFDLSSLLCLGADTPIYVPGIERESLLATDMAYRLEELGFTRVTRVRPGDSTRVGTALVHALPFFGEQPTTGDVLHPEVRNAGCTYLAEIDGERVLLVADSGRDREGDVREVAARARLTFGNVDVLFSGYRAFAVYPIHYLFSSVARYLLFVPPSSWTVRQKTMNDADGLLDTAESCGARLAIPYADGGAPWHWERGLGPQLDGAGTPNPAIDSPPELVARVAAERSSSREGPIASPVRVTVLCPGETLAIDHACSPRVERGPRQIWPYARRAWTQCNAGLVRTDGSALASARQVFRELEALLASARASGRLDHFHFMRKPPDLRLRLFGDPALGAELGAVLDRLVREGALVRWFPSIYEPESDRFGGPAAASAALAWFDADTTAWMALDRLRAEGHGPPSAEALCAAVASDLVFAAVDDRAEAWAVWRSYVAMLELPASDPDAAAPMPDDLAALLSRASGAVVTAVESYREANQRYASALRALWAEGALTRGLRAIVADAVLFLFHRHGLDTGAHARIAQALIRALDPTGAVTQMKRSL